MSTSTLVLYVIVYVAQFKDLIENERDETGHVETRHLLVAAVLSAFWPIIYTIYAFCSDEQQQRLMDLVGLDD